MEEGCEAPERQAMSQNSSEEGGGGLWGLCSSETSTQGCAAMPQPTQQEPEKLLRHVVFPRVCTVKQSMVTAPVSVLL